MLRLAPVWATSWINKNRGEQLGRFWPRAELQKKLLKDTSVGFHLPPLSVCVRDRASGCNLPCEGAFQKGREKVKLLGNSNIIGRSHKKQQLHWEGWWRKDMRFSQITRILILSVLISQVCRVFVVLLFLLFSSVLKFYCLFWEKLRLKLYMSLSEHVLKLAGQNILLIQLAVKTAPLNSLYMCKVKTQRYLQEMQWPHW